MSNSRLQLWRPQWRVGPTLSLEKRKAFLTPALGAWNINA